MNKAEDLANKYCEGSSFEDACMERPAYIAGYHQAEKDLALTWEDINDIIRIYEDVIETESGKNIYIKVLKRFKEMKK